MVIEQNAVYTVKEAAELLKMSEASMWRLVRSGELESVKLGKLRRIKGQALLSLLYSHAKNQPCFLQILA